MKLSKTLLLACAVLLTANACASDLPPIQPVGHVDLPRFMGDWYVIATIPSYLEKHACNAVETYTLKPDGKIATTFHYRKGAFDKPLKSIRSTAFVSPGTGNAVWGVQLIWPIKAQYIVAYLNADYSQVIVARDARDYVWVMARTPEVSPADYDALLARVQAMGYALDKIRKVPQSWPQAKR